MLRVMSPDPGSRYQGDFVAWRGGCVFLGMGGKGPIDTHSHYAIQLVIGAPAGLEVKFGRKGEFHPCAAALIPSGAPHTIDVSDCHWSAVLFVEPETTEGKALSVLLDGKLRCLDADVVLVTAKRLERAWRVEKSSEQVRGICTALVRDLAQASSREPTDPRVLSVIEFIREHVDESISLEQAAALVKLSPSRLRHLFVAQTGMPLRTYILWRRFLHVWMLLMQGETLSSAAHAAGFADSAHLSRTCRSMFGLAPSAMQMTGPISSRMKEPQHYFG
jgi:AraC family transcriptional regulator